MFLSAVARRVALSILSIFSPVYIYQMFLGMGYSSKASLIVVVFYFIVVFTSKLVTLIISEDVSRSTGFRGMIRLSTVPFFVFIPILILARDYPVLLIPSAVLWGIQAGLYWWGYHGYFIKTGEKKSFGKAIGEAGFLETAATVLTPILSAVVIKQLGFSAVFIVAGMFILLSFGLLGKGEDWSQKTDIRFADVVHLLLKHKSVSLAYFGSSAEAVLYMVFWPIFLVLTLGEVIDLGLIISSATLLAALFSIAAGEKVDRHGEKQVVSFGVPLVVSSWILRFFSVQTFAFVVSETIWNFGQRMVALPLNAITYRKATKAGRTASAILFRETAVSLGSLAAMFVAIILIVAGLNLSYMFLIAAFFSLFPLVSLFRKKFD